MDTKDKETLENLTKELGIALFGTGRGILSREKQDILEALQEAYNLGASDLAGRATDKIAEDCANDPEESGQWNLAMQNIAYSLNEIKK